jgi:hypothetical protein
MKDDYLSPNTGPGLRPTPAQDSSIGPMQHGRIVNPPRMAVFGGLVKLSPVGFFKNIMRIRRPGGYEK